MLIVCFLVAAVYFYLHHWHHLDMISDQSMNNKSGHNSNSNLPSYNSKNEGDGIIKVATWNLRVPFPPDIERNLSWVDRRQSIASAIATIRPHILALQEDCYFMSEDLMNAHIEAAMWGGERGAKLSDIYNRYGLFNRNGESYPTGHWPENAFSSIVGRDGEHNSVWYDKHRFGLMKNITFWMSRTPEVAGSSFDEITGRIVNCVLLEDKTCNKKNDPCMDIFFCSTHMPSGNATRQLLSVNVLSDMLANFHNGYTTKMTVNKSRSKGNNDNVVMMVSGDFNSAPGDDTYNAMVEAGFVDSRTFSKEDKSIEQYTDTTNDWYGNEDSLIDYVWIYTGKAERSMGYPGVSSVKHVPVPCCDDGTSLDRHFFNRTASDHLMVLAELVITYSW